MIETGPVEVGAIVQRVLAASMEHGNLGGIARALKGAGFADAANELVRRVRGR